MKSVTELKASLQKKWQRRYLPCGLLDKEHVFPLRVAIKKPTKDYILNNWQSVKTTVADYQKLSFVQWQQRETPVGKQELPNCLVFNSVFELADWLQKKAELKLYSSLAKKITQAHPNLLNWCLKYPEKILKNQQNWQKLLTVIKWLLKHPTANCYLREISLADIDSKFIEQHKTLLNELTNVLLPDLTSKNFEGKFNLKTKPETLRLRFLGQQNILGLQDIKAPLNEWQKIELFDLGIEKIFITENEINFLAFPKLKNALVIFGDGYGFANWSSWQSLTNLPIYYWGDLDSHGFAILNQLRKQFPQVKSMLMDEGTLLRYSNFWVEEQTPTKAALTELSDQEQVVYQMLSQYNYPKNIRLEQERVDLKMVKFFLKLNAITW